MLYWYFTHFFFQAQDLIFLLSLVSLVFLVRLSFLGVIVRIKITILAATFGISQFISVWAFGRKSIATIQVITMIAHTLRIMLHICMLASCYLPLLSVTLHWFLLRWFNNEQLRAVVGLHLLFLDSLFQYFGCML